MSIVIWGGLCWGTLFLVSWRSSCRGSGMFGGGGPCGSRRTIGTSLLEWVVVQRKLGKDVRNRRINTWVGKPKP